MDIGRVISALKSYFTKYISSHTVQGKTMDEDAQQKFTVRKSRFWRIFKVKIHHLIVNEKKEK